MRTASSQALARFAYPTRLDGGFTPAGLLALALGVAGAWFTASEALRTHDSPNPGRRSG